MGERESAARWVRALPEDRDDALAIYQWQSIDGSVVDGRIGPRSIS